MQVYVDEDRDKVAVIEREEYIEFVDAVGDVDPAFGRCLGSGDVMTLYKRKADKVRPVNRPHKGGLKPGGKDDWLSRRLVTYGVYLMVTCVA